MSESKSVRLTSVVTPSEADYIRRTADANDLTVSEFIRAVLVGFDDDAS